MNLLNSSISKINKLYKDKELKPSEVYEQVFNNAALSESIIHAHLKLFQEECIEASKLSDERFAKGKQLSQLDGIPIAIKEGMPYKPRLLLIWNSVHQKNYACSVKISITNRLITGYQKLKGAY